MEWDTDPEVPKFIRDSLRRRQGLPPEEVKLPTSEFEGPIPGHIQKAIGRVKSEEQNLWVQERDLAKRLSPEEAKRLIPPVNEARVRRQELARQLESEFNKS